METYVYPTKPDASRAAAKKAAQLLRDALEQRDKAIFIAATGASQFDFLETLVNEPGIDWSKTIMFHLDEYVGLPKGHPASFHLYLQQRLINRVHPGIVHLIRGDGPDPVKECKRVGKLIQVNPPDVAFVGIGENGHLAFNDPPADFITQEPFIVVELDQACRQQQFGEGWFKSFDEIPRRAISMSIQQIMKARAIICTVPEQRKAVAVKNCFTGEISPLYPSSILRTHAHAYVYLDHGSASLLPEGFLRDVNIH